MEPRKEQLAGLARLVADTAAQELDCGEVLDGLAALLECRQAGQPVEGPLLKIQQHLAVCPECLEEFNLLEGLYERGELQ